MALVSCPECKRMLSDAANYCPNCGFMFLPELPQEFADEKIALIKKAAEPTAVDGAIGIGCTVIVVVVLIFMCGGGRSCSGSGANSSSSSREVVYNSGYNGSVRQVKTWLKANAKDPGSLDFIEWSPVVKTDRGDFVVRVKYRAKNSFGGFVIANKQFYLDSRGNIVANADY